MRTFEPGTRVMVRVSTMMAVGEKDGVPQWQDIAGKYGRVTRVLIPGVSSYVDFGADLGERPIHHSRLSDNLLQPTKE